jgi:hypothetical protein
MRRCTWNCRSLGLSQWNVVNHARDVAIRIMYGRLDVPASFAEHALYYSVYPDRLSRTILGQPARPGSDVDAGRTEDAARLADLLGPDRAVLFRNLTPPGIAMERLTWCVLRVLVPGLQPLHGHHGVPFLGGPLWAPRCWKDWADMVPHPFP